MTPEEIEEMEKNIPEWKRNALATTGDAPKEEKKGVLRSLKDRVRSTDVGKKFVESEDYEKIKEMRGSYAEFRSKLSEGIENT